MLFVSSVVMWLGELRFGGRIRAREKRMPNGRPGDHPFTDIIYHGSSEFGEPVDSLVKELSKTNGFDEVREEVSDILWQHSVLGAERPDESREKALELLQAVKTKLQMIHGK